MASASYFKQVEDQEDAFDEELVRRRIAKRELARRFANVIDTSRFCYIGIFPA